MFFQSHKFYRFRSRPTAILFILALFTAGGLVLPAFSVAPETPAVVHQESLDSIYQARGYQPIWVAADGQPNKSARTLMSILGRADQEGLRPADYHDQALSRLRDRADPRLHFFPKAGREQIEALLTDAFLSFGLDLSAGRVDPRQVISQWENTRNPAEILGALVDMMITAPTGDQEPGFDSAHALDQVRPGHFDYQRLRKALAYYRQVDQLGGWTSVPAGEILRPGDRDPRVPLLRARLTGTAGPESWIIADQSPPYPWNWLAGLIPLTAVATEPDLYDADLATSVRSFQRRHGLVADALVGEKTLAALNESAARKADRIALNLERIRWLPAEPGTSFIRVNIPSCRLDMMEQGRSILSMKTVVGRPDRPTPVMHDQIRWLELNPYWNVPQKLVKEDILPKVLADSLYLQDRNFHVFQNWKKGASEIDLQAMDWAGLDTLNMTLKFRQDPGPRNPLGRIKFLFPNQFSVYLHDTNQTGHFARETRAFSSGCIRLEDPSSLARLLIPEMDLPALLDSTENQSFGLAQKVPIFIVYQTVWIDDSGRVNFAPDIYGYDARMSYLMVDQAKEILVSNQPPVPES